MKKLENKAEYLPLSELVKLENNPRTIKKADFEKLKDSIKSNPDYFEARPIICSDRTGKTAGRNGGYMSETVSVMPEIIKMRKEWKKKFGDTRVFDHFYMGLRDKIVAHHIQSMKEWQKLDKEIEKAEKNTWLFVEENSK